MRGGCSSVAKWEGCISRPSIDRRTACASRAACAATTPGVHALAEGLALAVPLPPSPPPPLLLLLVLGSVSSSWPTRAVRPPSRESCSHVEVEQSQVGRQAWDDAARAGGAHPHRQVSRRGAPEQAAGKQAGRQAEGRQAGLTWSDRSSSSVNV